MNLKFIDQFYELLKPKARVSAIEKIILYWGLRTLIKLILTTSLYTFLGYYGYKALFYSYVAIDIIVGLFIFINIYLLYENPHIGLRAFKSFLMSILININILFILAILPVLKKIDGDSNLPVGNVSKKRRAIIFLVLFLCTLITILKPLNLLPARPIDYGVIFEQKVMRRAN